MASTGGSWRIAGRLARREVRRHPWRHLLVTGLILVPVLAALAAFSAISTARDVNQRSDQFEHPDPEAISLTSDQLAFDPRAGADPVKALAEAQGLPPGTRTETSWATGDWLVGDQQRADGKGPRLTGTELIEAPEGSVRADRFVIGQGRLPRADDEILLTDAAADEGGWSIGDTVMSARSGRTFRVVGTGVLGDAIHRRAAAVAGLPQSFWVQPLLDLDSVHVQEVYDDASRPTVADQRLTAWVTEPGIRADLVAHSFDGADRSLGEDRRIGLGLTMAAAAICAVVAVVASAALAISSRRQLRTIGLLSTIGTDPATVRRAMILQGAIPGAVAGVAAVALALIGAAAIDAAGLVERYTEVAGAHVVLSTTGAVVVVLLGLASGIAAAWQPARTASRVPTLAALAGRRPVGPVPTSVPVAGAILWACGACLLLFGFGSDRSGIAEQLQPFFVIGGVAAIALGGVGLAPLLIAGLAPLASRARGTWRMGLRGLARHRMQSAATVAAIGVVLAVPVGLLTSRNVLQDRVHLDLATTACCETTATAVPDEEVDLFRGEYGGARVEVFGSLRGTASADAVRQAQDLLGPTSALIRSVQLVDQDGNWKEVASIDEGRAHEVLEPWAAEAITSGRAIALDADDRGGPVTFTAAGDTVTLTADPLPERYADAYPPIDSAYLVGTRALAGVGADRPPDNLIVARAEGLTRSERAELRRLSGFDPAAARSYDDPTLERVQAAVADAAESGTEPGATVDIGLMADGREPATEPIPDYEAPARTRWDRTLLALAVVSGLVALLVLTITLSLRSVDSEPDRRAALAAGVAPRALRRQRAFEGVVLALLGAVLALPLGWIPVTAARVGVDGGQSSGIGVADFSIALPGWEVVPFLLAPALAAAVLWTVLPAVAEAVRRARRRDLPDDLIPRF